VVLRKSFHEPLLNPGWALAFAGGVIAHLVGADLADGEILGFWMGEIQAADRRAGGAWRMIR